MTGMDFEPSTPALLPPAWGTEIRWLLAAEDIHAVNEVCRLIGGWIDAAQPPAPAVTRDELAILAEEVLFEHRERRDGMQPADGNFRCNCGHSTGQQPGPGRPGGRRPGHHPVDFHRAQVLADELARYDIRLRPTEGSDTDGRD